MFMFASANAQSLKQEHNTNKLYDAICYEYSLGRASVVTFRAKLIEHRQSLVLMGYKDVPEYDKSSSNNLALLNYGIDRDTDGNIIPPSEPRLLSLYSDAEVQTTVTVSFDNKIASSTEGIPTIKPDADDDTVINTSPIENTLPTNDVPEIEEGMVTYNEFADDPLYERYPICDCSHKSIEELEEMNNWMEYKRRQTRTKQDRKIYKACQTKIKAETRILKKQLKKLIQDKHAAYDGSYGRTPSEHTGYYREVNLERINLAYKATSGYYRQLQDDQGVEYYVKS